jgi:phosphodiesterase/alkaline phosphatase D-like protein
MAFDREGLGRLLAAMPVYLTPDDHEWTDGFPAEGPLLREHWGQGGARQGLGERNEQAIELANRAVTAFQRLQAPAEGLPAPLAAAVEARGYGVFRHGCARVFVIDSRIGRDRQLPRVVADGVLAALASWLNEEEAASMLSVIACGSVVLPGLRPNWDPANPGVLDTWQYAPRQRATLLDNLAASRAAGRFVLLSGDYHVSGAAQVQCAGQVIGMAVVAPPLYAPMPYANATPEAVDLEERIPLAAGELSLLPLEGGSFERGSGLAVLEVRAEGRGFTVTVHRELQVWEEGVTRSFETTLHLPGSAAVRPALPPDVPPQPAPAQPAPA